MCTMTEHPSDLRGLHPRPQMIRPESWWSLDGQWDFAFDDDNVGLRDRWYRPENAGKIDQQILVPFPPESPASGIGDHDDHAALWYRRTFALPSGDLGTDRLVLHLGAVDHECDVWVDGQHAIRHEGGQTAFQVDVTDLLDPALATDAHEVVVRATDDRTDVEQPRGKQDWLPEQHVIWYNRTSGIWRTVWIERTPAIAVGSLHWTADVPGARVELRVRFGANVPDGTRVQAQLWHDGTRLGLTETAVTGSVAELSVPLPGQTNGQAYERLLWSPESPVLLDATVTVLGANGETLDVVDSYCGLRSIAVVGDEVLLNDRPFRMRAVLEQGYWPQSHLTPPTLDALREEVELTKTLGFNAVRIHQKVEDPRYLYWCDRLGLAVWGETAGAYRFSDEAVAQLTREWIDIVRRDLSHPCIIAWVPFNESWGVQHLAHDPAQRAYSKALTALTRALDPSRPVISNDGWEHTDSDLLTIHDYAATGDVLASRYGNTEAVDRTVRGLAPAGRRLWVEGPLPESGTIPVLLTEFGGVSFDPTAADGSWGYSTASSAEDLQTRLEDIMGAVHASMGIRLTPVGCGCAQASVPEVDPGVSGPVRY